MGIPYGNLTNQEFLYAHGISIERRLENLETDSVKVTRVQANYGGNDAEYTVEFEWGTPARTALNEVTNVINSFSSELPKESRDNRWIWYNNENSGFFAASFFSSKRSLDDLYKIIEPAFKAQLSTVADAENTNIWNPTHKEIRITPHPESMAAFQLLPKHISSALDTYLTSYRGGSIQMGYQKFQIQVPRISSSIEGFGQMPITTPTGKTLHLSDIAEIDYAPSSIYSNSFKTNGAPSLILFASPMSGGNVKRMAEDIIKIIEKTMKTLPDDIQYRILVDPSEFVRSAVRNVIHEVFIAAFIAVAVLLFFIGSFRNVFTAAIEIPLSMVLAFILMRLFNMNLNLISLGGLALSAGMNVDASVVVMENIIRHFEMAPGPHSYRERLDLICKAVREVWLPVVASTVASLVVFLPLAFTSELTNAVLGDLAKAVVFSHGFSAIVALILVPTIRLQLLGTEKPHAPKPPSRIQRFLSRVENGYAHLLEKFLDSKAPKRLLYGGLPLVLALLVVLVLPRLPREIVGKPDTDWLILGIHTRGNTLNSQMEQQTMEVERELLRSFSDEVLYTFTQVRGANRSTIMSRLKDKSRMNIVWKKMEEKFKNSPTTEYWTDAWNPSELKIPDPPDLKVVVRGGTPEFQTEAATRVYDTLQETKMYGNYRRYPHFARDRGITLRPYPEQWSNLQKVAPDLTTADVSDLLRVATDGRKIGYLPIDGKNTDIVLRYPTDRYSTAEDIGALPLGVGSKIIPLKALASVEIEAVPPTIFRENEQTMVAIDGRVAKGKEGTRALALAKAKEAIAQWREKEPEYKEISVTFEEPSVELNQALKQLAFAVSVSVALIFLTILLQFGSLAPTLLILVSIPLGLIGVISALAIFNSTLSLNSALGVILLNGIAVANSILLVDFIRRLTEQGMAPRIAAVEASRKRLRPILITSLTTILGMFPIALGLGDGGRILQPLGITVSAGLWVSTALTLFLVPALQVSYLEWQAREKTPFRFWGFLKPGRLQPSPALWIVCLGAAAFAYEALGNPLPMDQAIKAILDRSPEISGQQSQVDATQARNVPAHLAHLPSLTLTGNYETGRRAMSFGSTASAWGAEATLKLNLFRFGALQAGSNRASAREERQEWQLKQVSIQAEAGAVESLLAYISALKQEFIRKRSTEIRDSALAIAKQRYQKGLLAQEEVDKVAIDRDNAVATLKDAQVTSLRAQSALQVLLGHTNVELDWPWITRMQKFKIASGDPEALRTRPDWQAAEANLRSRYHQKNEALGEIFPSLDFAGSYGYANNRAIGLSGSLWTAGVYLTVPLFDRLTEVSEYREQIYLASAAEAELEAVRRRAKQEWQIVQGQFPIALSTAQMRENTVKISQRLYDTNLQRFRRGLVNVNDLMQDQDRLLDSEILLVRGWERAHLGYSDYCHTLGKLIPQCP